MKEIKKEDKNKIVIYTAIFDGKDDLQEPLARPKNCDLVCFTDNPNLKSDYFQIEQWKRKFEDPTRDARMLKILSHKIFPDYEYTIWIDGRTLIVSADIEKMIDEFLFNSHIAVYKHPERNCIYKEAQACIDLGKDDPQIIKKQIDRYRMEGYPKNNNLISSGIILRRNLHPKIAKLNEDWWKEVKNFSRRDQLSFNYVVWKNKVFYNIVPHNIYNNKYFKILDHKVIEETPYRFRFNLPKKIFGRSIRVIQRDGLKMFFVYMGRKTGRFINNQYPVRMIKISENEAVK